MLLKLLALVLAAVCAVMAIILTMAAASSTSSQHADNAAAGLNEGARDGGDRGCITLLGLDFDLRCALRRGRSGEGY
jgi:Spy/CpxP family protein refolding chaperone